MNRRTLLRPAGALLLPALLFGACRSDSADVAETATTTTTAAAAVSTSAAPDSASKPASTTAAAPAPAPEPEPAPQPAADGTAEAAVLTTPGEQFNASFDTPEDFFERFQREVFFGLDIDRSSIAQWQGDHSMGCEGPTTQRTVHSDGAHDDEMFWWCAPGGDASKGHLMTSMYTAGYAQVLFAPNESFTDVTVVCWDQNFTDLPRKWTQVVIVPEALYHENDGALHYVNPGLQPVPATDGLAIGALPTDAYGEPDGSDLQRSEEWAAGRQGAPPWDSYLLTFTNGSISQWSRQGEESYFNAVATDDKAKRFRQCATDNGDGTITHINQLADGTTREITLAGSFPDGEVRVIFQDDTYDSFKTDLGDRSGGDDPRATWHWDNISVT